MAISNTPASPMRTTTMTTFIPPYTGTVAASILATPSRAPLKRISTVQFGIMSSEEIKSLSVAKIEHPETIEGGVPKIGGLADPRLGTNDRSLKCATCSGSMSECPGHFGHIELARPVYHIGFIDKLKKVLECICFYCGRLKIDPEQASKVTAARSLRESRQRLNTIWSLCKGRTKCDVMVVATAGRGNSSTIPEEISSDEEENDWVSYTKTANGKENKKSHHSQSKSTKNSNAQEQTMAIAGCGQIQPQIRREGLRLLAMVPSNASKSHYKTIDHHDEPQGRIVISPERVLSLLKKLKDEDLILLGFSPIYARPEWMMLSVIPVPPPPVRPAIQMTDSAISKGEDDLTHKLADIIKANRALAMHEAEGAPAHLLMEFEALLQFHVATFIDNEIPGQPQALQKSGRPLKSIRARLKGKEGRLRGNLMGKRVDFSARTVISPDPNLELDEVGVPRSIAMTLTVPERVTPWNVERLSALVKAGPRSYPGARYVIKGDGTRVDLRFAASSSMSENCGESLLALGGSYQSSSGGGGVVVERHLLDGDVVLFNRQPSLHKMSMMGHRVRVMPYSTFRLNLSVTTPYNADFDGDEMNMHVPQGMESASELKLLTSVPTQIISPQACKPVMGIVQDSLTGIRKMTRRDTFVDWDTMMGGAFHSSPPGWNGRLMMPAILKPYPQWTGKQMVTMVLPPGLNLGKIYHSTHVDSPSHDDNPADTEVLIEDGHLLMGILCKRSVGTSAGGLIHVMINDRHQYANGENAAALFFGAIQRVVNFWLRRNGFSIGIGDTVADTQTMSVINSTIQAAKRNVSEIIKRSHQGSLATLPGMTPRSSFEHEICKELNKARDHSGSSAQRSLREQNNVKQMVVAGSKGTFINLSQMTACVGQQTVEGSRIPMGFESSRRTLPHFYQSDDGPESRGFVQNSYLRGLTPQEFFFHAMGGREGLIDTAVKTAETGYIQRRLVKALEDVIVSYDGTIRNSLADVVQFAYGDDGMDAMALERVRVPGGIPGNGIVPSLSNTIHRNAAGSVTIPALKQMTISSAPIGMTSNTPSGTFALPINIPRLLWNAQVRFRPGSVMMGKESHPMIIAHNEAEEMVNALLSELNSNHHYDFGIAGSLTQMNQLQCLTTNNHPLVAIMMMMGSVERAIRHHLAPGTLSYLKISKEALHWVIGEIRDRVHRAQVHPGEMVGVIAAQSIGEPATQMTLNTFHLAGVSHGQLTHGVPRLKELINATINTRTPSLTVRLISITGGDGVSIGEGTAGVTDEYQHPSSVQNYSQTQPSTTGQAHSTKALARAKEVAVLLEATPLRALCSYSQIIFDPDTQSTVLAEDEDLVEAYFALPDPALLNAAKRASPWLLRLVLDRIAMLDHRVTMSDVARALVEAYGSDILILHSDDNAAQLVVRCRILRLNEDDDHHEESSRDSDEESSHDSDKEELFLRKVESNMIESIWLKGIPGITRVFIVEDDDPIENSGLIATTVIRQSPFILQTAGIGLGALFGHTPVLDMIDARRCTSNSVLEIASVLGIEAARTALLRELRNVIEADGSYVNTRHLMLLADIMTRRGMVTGITRHGTNRDDHGALMRCSFEETVEILLEAAATGESNAASVSLSECVMMGQMAPIGTGSFDLMLDEEALHNAMVPALGASLYPIIAAQAQAAFGVAAGSATPSALGYRSPWMTPMHQYHHPSSSPQLSYLRGSRSPGSGGEFGYRTPIGTTPGYSTPGDLGFSPFSTDSGSSYWSTSSSVGRASPLVGRISPMSPGYSPTSPGYSPTSPGYSPTSPNYSPTSPSYSPTSPSYSSTSPSYSPTSPSYSPTSPSYSPTSPSYSPTSPSYSPTSPSYSPTSPSYSPTSPSYSPTSPSYSPTSPSYSPTSPKYSPTSPGSSQTTGGTVPSFSPRSPGYFPSLSSTKQKK